MNDKNTNKETKETSSNIEVIVTMPPHAPYLDEVARHPIVSGLRLNTVMPTHDKLENILQKFVDTEKDIWIDLKSKQLRVTGYWIPPYTEIEVSHPITVKTPTTAYFSDGQEAATVLSVKGNKLLMQQGPKRVVGPGESLNIPDPSLRIHGFLTESDKAYIKAAEKVGINNYMLSFVESKKDEEAFLKYVPNANLVSKIESQRGINYIKGCHICETEPLGRLMAARGDMYVELEKPHKVNAACELLVKTDTNAIAASRILSSLNESYTPSMADLADIDNLYRMGYRTFMLGDEICQEKEKVLCALNVLASINSDLAKPLYERV